jgi:predicted DNA-binding transcriptional regulator YafY
MIPVLWTIISPQDSSFRNNIERRRYRLQRFLCEAKARGASARLENLAYALNVSPRTIKRDMAVLRSTAFPELALHN